ncbi:hypothetical protein LV89_04926 [Arcicella aurantiaca]|uniref:Uncharacterized protein n=1 Tax=Arcicella aurantiaca TaxID=591202 RepID=A0A316DD22_9BACT|nr:hypothetical protein [Arcicella aurantiaca]PWK16111.1 hypothetical protein LV89_04926 [Arcicella aurantiaca]
MSSLLKSIENIYAQRSLIVKELEKWSFSTNEKSSIDNLIFNLQNNICKSNDIETILFQIECFNKDKQPLRVDLSIPLKDVKIPNVVQMYGVWNFHILKEDGSGEDYLYPTFEGAMNYCNDSDNWHQGTYPLCICKVDVEKDKIRLNGNGSYSFEYLRKQYWQLVFDDC